MAGPLEALFAGQMATQPGVLDRLMSETIVPGQPQNTEGIERLIGTPVDWSGVATRGRDDTSMSPVNMAMGLIGGPSLRGIRAYHGSPHKFDKFSMDRIGTGEGAQAYGHGLYFAENELTAKAYRDQVKDMAMLNANNKRMRELAREMEKLAIPGRHREFRDQRGYALAEEYDQLMAQKMAPGHMYEVNIRANPEQFLDWDRPLSGQSPAARKALDRAIPELTPAMAGLKNDPTTADLVQIFGNADRAGLSSRFREAGVPGIKYLDQGSRTAGQGSSNYVVFDDSIIDILKRYGIMGGAVSPLATLMQENPQ